MVVLHHHAVVEGGVVEFHFDAALFVIVWGAIAADYADFVPAEVARI